MVSEEGLQAGGFRNVLNLHEFFRGQFALSGLDQQVNFAAPRRWRSLHVAIFAAVCGCVVLLSGCNEFNPNLGAAAQQSSSITYITPASRPAGCSGFTLDIMGEGFVDGAVVAWNGSARATNFESSTELLATINASDLATGMPVTIVVSTPPVVGVPKGNNLSNFVPFTIAPAVPSSSCPIPPTFPPTLIALSQPSGDAGTSVEIAGNYFGGVQNNSTVTFGGVAATPTAWSGTLITVTVPTGAPVGSVMVVVTVSGVPSITLNPGENVFNVLPTPTTTAIECFVFVFGDGGCRAVVFNRGCTPLQGGCGAFGRSRRGWRNRHGQSLSARYVSGRDVGVHAGDDPDLGGFQRRRG